MIHRRQAALLVESRLGAALPLLASTAARNMDRRVAAQRQLPAKVVKITVFSQTSAAVRRFDKLSDSQLELIARSSAELTSPADLPGPADLANLVIRVETGQSGSIAQLSENQ